MKKTFRMFVGIIGALLIFTALSQLLILIGPIIAGLFIGALELQPDPQLAKTVESVGNIFVLVISIYAGIKTYKTINGKKKDITISKEPIEENIQ